MLDAGDAAAGINLVEFFTSWEFTWANGTDTFSTSSATNAFVLPSLNFVIDSSGEVSSASLCTDDCTVGKPVSNVGLSIWNASVGTISAAVGGNRVGTWSGAISGSVPIPETGTLMLLGIGLAGMGFARRRNID